MRAKIIVPVLAIAAGACQEPLDTTRTVDSYASFGAVIYREACQRVAYTGQLAQQAAGEIDRVDVSGSLGRGVCVAGEAPPLDAPPKLAAIVGQRAPIVANVDAILPDPFLSTLEQFLEQILPLYDDGTLERAIVGLGDLLRAMADDPEVPPALARLGVRHGYRPASLGPGLIYELVYYPDLDDFVGSVLGLIGPDGAAEADWRQLLAAGSKTLTNAEPEVDPTAPDRTLRLALDVLLTTHPDLGGGTARPAVERDVRGLARVAVDANGAVVAPFVDLDHDGLADVDAVGRFVGADGQPLAVATPFPVAGVPDTAPRDALGRALTAADATTTLYQYLDLDSTVLAGALREAVPWLDPAQDTALGLAWGATALMGPRAMQTKTFTNHAGAVTDTMTYNGFDTTQSAALDLLHSFVQLLGGPEPDATLAAAATLLDQFESPTSRAVAAMLDASDRGKLHDEAQLFPTSTVFDDLVPLIARTLRVPGLAEDLVAALQDPHVRGVAPMIARMMTTVDQVDFNHTNAPIGDARGAPDFDVLPSALSTPVDRTQPDTDYNRSLMQRIAHLVHDANNVQFCNKDGAVALGSTFPRCRLFRIDDLALFFALNLASDSVRMDVSRRATTYNKASFREQITAPALKATTTDTPLGDTVLETLIGIRGFTRFPTPKALARALFLRPDDSGMPGFLRDTTEPTTCSDGDRFIDVHDRSIVAWELTLPNNPSGFADDTFVDAVRPLVDAFAKHDECLAVSATGVCTSSQNAIKIFVDLLATLHTHWASPQSSYFGRTYQATDPAAQRFAFPDNVVSFEPLLAEVLTGDLVPSVIDLAPILEQLMIGGTRPALPVLIAAMRYAFDPDVAPAGLAYRSGAIATVKGDGQTPVPRATPFHLLADAFANKRAVLANLATTPDGAIQANKWKAATSTLIDQVLTVDRVGDTWQFRNRRFHAITQIAIGFLRGRIQAHTAAGDLDNWVHHELTSDLTDHLAGPVFAALGDLVTRVEHDAAARDQLYGLLRYMNDEMNHEPTFRTVLTTAADLAQLLLDDRDLVPIARVLGTAMAPDKATVEAAIALVKKSHDLDTDKALLTILRNLYQPDARGVVPASDLADIVSEINRTVPGVGGDLDDRDERTLLDQLHGFATDNQRGLMRFVRIVQHRDGQ